MKIYQVELLNTAIPIPENYKDCIKLIKSDYYRCTGRFDSVLRMYVYGIKEPAFKFLFWHRLGQIHGWLYYLAKWQHRRYLFKYNLYIPLATRIGYGFI